MKRLILFGLLLSPAAFALPPAEVMLDQLDGDEMRWLLKKQQKGHKAKADAQQARITDLEQALALTEKSGTNVKQTLEQRAAALDRENKELRARLSALGQDNARAAQTLEELRRAHEQAEKRNAQFRDMVAKFKSMVDAGKLQVEFRGGLMLVKLPDNILFDPGKTALKSAGKEAVTQVAQILSGIEGRKFQVTGHTDNVPMKSGKYKSNWELSSARAVEVVKVMIASGMDPKRLSAAGYADQLPVAENDTVIGRLQNRRIEIVVQPNLEELPSAVQ
jgi:chemotaxis protein MotB